MSSPSAWRANQFLFPYTTNLATALIGSSSVRKAFVHCRTRAMRPHRWRHGSCLALTTWTSLILALWSSKLQATPFAVDDTGWEGCSAFVAMAVSTVGAQNVVAGQELNWGALKPEDGVIILHPTRPVNPDELSAFLRAGGRVAVLDDYGAGDQVLSRYHIQRIAPPQRPSRALRNNPALAIAEPVADPATGRSLSLHPVVANVVQVVTNHPTGLEHPSLSPLLAIRRRGEPDLVVAVAGQVGERGRLLAVGDPSIVINLMLRYPGNREFGSALARYLVDDDTWGKRGGKVYVVANDFRERGTFGNESSMAKLVTKGLRDLAALLAETRQQGLGEAGAIGIGVLTVLGALAWLASAAARAYHRHPPRFARAVPLVAQGGVAGRAAVLAAPTTHRALAVLELKSALEEAMASRLGLETPASATALLDRARDRAALDESRWKALKKLLLMMSMVETSVAAGRPIKIRERDVQSAANVVRDLLQTMETNGRSPSPPDDRS